MLNLNTTVQLAAFPLRVPTVRMYIVNSSQCAKPGSMHLLLEYSFMQSRLADRTLLSPILSTGQQSTGIESCVVSGTLYDSMYAVLRFHLYSNHDFCCRFDFRRRLCLGRRWRLGPSPLERRSVEETGTVQDNRSGRPIDRFSSHSELRVSRGCTILSLPLTSCAEE